MNETTSISKKTKYTYAMSGMGRDMMYTLYSTYLLVFFTDVIGVSNWELIAVGTIIAIARIWDAINDPMMGIIIDNTHTRFGKFKPWILIGALTSAICFFLLFQDFGLSGTAFVVVFAILYVLSGMTFTMNDIAYWSMYPSFTTDPREREKIGSLARVFASLGMFITIAFVPIFYQDLYPGTPKEAFTVLAGGIGLIFIISQILIFINVKEHKNPITKAKQVNTKFKDILKVIFKNDQLVVIIVAIFLFNTGYFITTALGIYFFNYDFNKYGGVEFMLFSIILAVSQLSALILFPFLAKKMTRKKIFGIAILMISVGYALFLSVGNILPQNMIFVGLAGFVLFSGEGFIQVLVLCMLADTTEYGQWKLGTRNESVVFAINPFMVKLATSVQTIIVAATLAVSGLNEFVINPVQAATEADPNISTEAIRALIAANVTDEMLLMLRTSMVVIPFILIMISYVIYRWKFKIDTKMYQQITEDLLKRVENQE